MNDFAGLTPALLAADGIGELPPVVQPHLMREGRLVEVMPDWRFPSFDLSLVHLGSRHISKPCRLFKEFANSDDTVPFPRITRVNSAEPVSCISFSRGVTGGPNRAAPPG